MDGVRLYPTNATDKVLYLDPGQRLGIVPCTGGGQPASSAPVWIKVDAAPGGALLATTWALLDLDGRYPTNETESISWAEAPPLPLDASDAGDAADTGGKAAPPGKPPIFIPPQPIIPPLGNLVLPKPTKTIVFNMNTAKAPNGNNNQFTINGISLQPPDDGPSLIELIYGPGYTQPVPGTPLPGGAGWNVYDNKLGDVVEIVLNNYSPSLASHPFHTHGASKRRRGERRGRRTPMLHMLETRWCGCMPPQKCGRIVE